jgi:hypothetical protein
MIDSWDDEDSDNREFTFGFCVGLIPKTIEDREEIKMNFNDDFWNGHIWGFWIYPTYKVVNSEVTFKGLKIYNYDSSPNHQIADRKTAVALKRLLVNIFDPIFDYPRSIAYRYLDIKGGSKNILGYLCRKVRYLMGCIFCLTFWYCLCFDINNFIYCPIVATIINNLFLTSFQHREN